MATTEVFKALPRISINDLREKYFRGEALSKKESDALKRFEQFQLQILSEEKDEQIFHKKYLKLQVMANLSPFEDFLNEDLTLI